MSGSEGGPEGTAAHARRVVRALARAYPAAECALVHRNPFELLAATILSAQCTDKMVNLVTPGLFARYPDAASLAEAEPAELERLIHRTGFFRAKARSLIGMAAALAEEHGGEVSRDLEALTKMPGVGRKTANVVLGVAYGLATGVVVDTHVKRLAYRLGMTSETDPVKVERDLMAVVPRKDWIDLSHRLIAHGRAVCAAQRPKCRECVLRKICPRAGLGPLGPT